MGRLISGVIDGGGLVGSAVAVCERLRHVGVRTRLLTRVEELADVDLVIIPGVGSFGQVSSSLVQSGFASAICAHHSAGRPIVGICSGMHVLFGVSDESPGAHGLGLLAGRVQWLHSSRRPRIGWFETFTERGVSSSVVPPGSYYFAHALAAQVGQAGAIGAVVESVSSYDEAVGIAAVVRAEGILGLQFHPEKSQSAGLGALHAIVQWAERQ